MTSADLPSDVKIKLTLPQIVALLAFAAVAALGYADLRNAVASNANETAALTAKVGGVYTKQEVDLRMEILRLEVRTINLRIEQLERKGR